MNSKRLRQLQDDFLARYPGGFAHPELQAVGKKHKFSAMVEQTRAAFGDERAFDDEEAASEAMIRLISRASMVSMFEKPKFRDFVRALRKEEKAELVQALRAQLHGDEQAGFEAMVDALDEGKLAKWSLLTILPNYFRPDEEVFVKPTTAKGVIASLDLRGLTYKPRPSWTFYVEYRRQILSMRALCDPCLAPSNAAFSGFLMMAIKPRQTG